MLGVFFPLTCLTKGRWWVASSFPCRFRNDETPVSLQKDGNSIALVSSDLIQKTENWLTRQHMLTIGFLKGYGIRLSSARIGNREGEASVTGIRPISIIGRFPVHGFVRAFYRSPSFMVPFRQVLASLCPGFLRSIRSLKTALSKVVLKGTSSILFNLLWLVGLLACSS